MFVAERLKQDLRDAAPEQERVLRFVHPQKEENMESPYLANLEEDEPELNNHAKEYPEIVEKLTSLHNTWAAELER